METLIKVLEAVGLPFAYDHFAEGESPEPPFICYLTPGSDNFAADGQVYFKIDDYHIELYTDFKDLAVEAKLEEALDAASIFITSPKPGSSQKSCMRSFINLNWR